MDISNNEFHRKYLEYFRRLYKDDESEYNGSDDNDDATTIAGYDNDVSAIQVPGLVKHDRPSSPPPTSNLVTLNFIVFYLLLFVHVDAAESGDESRLRLRISPATARIINLLEPTTCCFTRSLRFIRAREPTRVCTKP